MKYTRDECYNNSRSSCRYFIGSTEDIVLSNGNRGIAILSNPCDSGVNLLFNGFDAVNLSSSPVRVDVYSFADVQGDVSPSPNVTRRDLSCPDYPSKGEILYGNDNGVSGGMKVATLVASPFSRNPGPIRLPITIPPGGTRMAIFTVLGELNSAVISVIYDWSEVPLE